MAKAFLALAAAFGTLVPAVAPAAVTFNEASVFSASSAQIDGVGVPDEDFATASELPPLGVVATSSQSATADGARAEANSTVSANFLSAAQGEFTFAPREATAQSTGEAGAFSYNDGIAEYMFATSSVLNFTLRYDTFGASASTGSATEMLGHFFADLEGPSTFAEQISLNEIGSFTRKLAAGDYTFRVSEKFAFVSAGPGAEFASASASQGGTFTFSLSSATTPVPEPATWAMMIFGFGAVGCALRRRPSKVLARAG